MFFIHKFVDGAMVKFVKEPQVRHIEMPSLSGVKVGSYIRTIRGRIAKVISIYQKDIISGSYEDRIERVWKFECKFLDNGEILHLTPTVTMGLVKVNIISLISYKLYKFFYSLS